MGLFSRRKKEPTCNHKWKDFPWYITIYDGYVNGYYRFTCKVTEPYVCVKCKEVREIDLVVNRYTSSKERQEYVEKLLEQYPNKIKPAVEVKDMIADEVLVDREYLKIIEQADLMSSAESVLESQLKSLFKKEKTNEHGSVQGARSV